MTNKLKNKSKGPKSTERLNTRASARTEPPAKSREHGPTAEGRADAEKIQSDSIDIVTPSATVSTTTTRSSSVDPPHQTPEGSAKQKSRNFKSKKKVGTTSKKIAKAKQTTAKTIEIDYLSHSSDDADGLKVKREYRRKRNRGEDKAGYFKELRERLLAYKKKELEEEEATLKAGTHPKYVEEMKRVDEEYQKTRELQRQKRDHGFAHANKEYDAGVLQIKQQYVNERRELRKELLNKLEISKYQTKREYNELTTRYQSKFLDLIVKEGSVQPAMNDFERADDVENDIRIITLDTQTPSFSSKVSNAPQPISMEHEFRSRLSLSLQPSRSNDSTGNGFNNTSSSIFLSHGGPRSRHTLNIQTSQSNNFVPPPTYIDYEPRSRQSQNRNSSSNINRIGGTSNIANWNSLQASSIAQVN
ncbi:5288_t:CDS:2, partial [Acaulospora morrowiae]